MLQPLIEGNVNFGSELQWVLKLWACFCMSWILSPLVWWRQSSRKAWAFNRTHEKKENPLPCANMPSLSRPFSWQIPPHPHPSAGARSGGSQSANLPSICPPPQCQHTPAIPHQDSSGRGSPNLFPLPLLHPPPHSSVTTPSLSSPGDTGNLIFLCQLALSLSLLHKALSAACLHPLVLSLLH